MRLRTRAFCLAVTALVVAPAAVPSAAPSPYAGIVVFGTSLSDSGNAFALRGGTNTPPDYDLDPLLVPTAPYARGGHHFSDGATWIEQLARSFGLAVSARPAFSSQSGGATNYAVAGARPRHTAPACSARSTRAPSGEPLARLGTRRAGKHRSHRGGRCRQTRRHTARQQAQRRRRPRGTRAPGPRG